MNLLPLYLRRDNFTPHSVGFFVFAACILTALLIAIHIVSGYQEEALLQAHNDNVLILAGFDPHHSYTAASLQQLLADRAAFDAAIYYLMADAHSVDWLHGALSATPAQTELTSLYFRGGTLTIFAAAPAIEIIDLHRAFLAEIFYDVLPGAVTFTAHGYIYELIAENPR